MKVVALTVIASVFVISALASLGYGPVLFSFVLKIPGRDLTGHFVLMGLLSLSVNLWLAEGPWEGALRRIARVTAWVSVAVTLEELSQFVIPKRNFSTDDLSASVAGVVVGALTAVAFFAWRSRRQIP